MTQTKHPKVIREKLLELAALATLSDQMPLEEDNRELVDRGINALLSTQRKGLIALIELGEADVQTDVDVFHRIIAPLNSSKLRDHISTSYLLLIETSPKKARSLAQQLIKQNRQKRELIAESVRELIEKIDKREDGSLVIFEVNGYWPVPALGVIASKLLHVYKKPIFLFKQGEKESVGSARLPKKVDGVIAMTSCKKLLEEYGGHAPARGCRLQNKNLTKFKKCLEKYFSKKICKK